MLRFVTRILLLLLIVAVPLQGASAAAMMTKEAIGGRGLNQVMIQSHEADESLVMTTSADGDDDCLVHSATEQAAPVGKSVKHSGHACPGCAACSLCSVVPFSFPLSIHLDDSVVQATFSLNARFVSHIPDALQRPPVFRV
ncbi:hypothetical protein [Ralstonia chuxiongensis]|uniref:hypothetical protein n=1 Tax=Ralstonia chuxiongensis TaxID=2957504 RepID=UPI00292E5946|nr:hypothetical protein [Ralstonia chuxiongensis]